MGIPIICLSKTVGLIVKPNAYLFALFTFSRVSENVVNHTGIEHWLLDLLSLRILLFRASVSHHDSHHYFSNHGGNVLAKNYAESFYLWDVLFGTYRDVSSMIKTR